MMVRFVSTIRHPLYFPHTAMKSHRTLALLSCTLLLLAACGKAQDTVTVENPSTETGEILQTDKVEVVMNNGKAITDPIHGKEKGFWYGAIGGVGDVVSSGVGYTYAFEDGSYLHTLNLNIKVLPKGEYYVAWLTEAGNKNPVKIGDMASLFGDARHTVRLDTKTDLGARTHMLVTKETTKDPSQPGTVVSEGDVKRYDRPQ